MVVFVIFKVLNLIKWKKSTVRVSNVWVVKTLLTPQRLPIKSCEKSPDFLLTKKINLQSHCNGVIFFYDVTPMRW